MKGVYDSVNDHTTLITILPQQSLPNLSHNGLMIGYRLRSDNYNYWSLIEPNVELLSRTPIENDKALIILKALFLMDIGRTKKVVLTLSISGPA
ncbi:hypothetical protein Zmor_001825 [Zophobas morio]|uniref:Uncharacterized protein n=1 Tax=Zophobas morio TaxID=2755281 RepID=A0AA38MT70_9CUCU|nr:hypothetical protein Zmor_001825 [Zophobas morio]